MTVFDASSKKHFLGRTCFLDDPVSVARYDQQKYPAFEKLTTKQLGFFWQPAEVDLTNDKRDFRSLTAHEQHIFTSNLKRQILLDSVQGRAPSLALMPIVSLPEIENWIEIWSFSEMIHSRSYQHILRNVYPNPSAVFDTVLDTAEIVDCAADISKCYDDLVRYTTGGNVSCTCLDYDRLEHKRRLWRCLMSINILEGIRFYVSFACSWAFAEIKKMEGNAKIIRLICRDENLHLAGTQHLLKILPSEDEDFVKIRDECTDQSVAMFKSAAEQEKQWARYLFKDGSMIGLNAPLLCSYVEWIANKRMSAVGLHPLYKQAANPLPWTERWIAGKDVQVAPQETEISTYIVGGVKRDVTPEFLNTMSL